MIPGYPCMDQIGNGRKRRTFHWPESAQELISGFLSSTVARRGQHAIAALATRLATLTGNPRDACFRFLHQHGIAQKRQSRPWTKAEQQQLLDLLESCTVEEIARTLHRSASSISSMLHRLGESTRRGRDWFTPYTLAEALHVRVDEVQSWISKGWLRCRVVETAGLTKRIIDPEDFSAFVKRYGPSVVGRRLKREGLAFVQNFVFPPKHAHLLPLRKHEDNPAPSSEDEELEDSALDETA
jgi:hypothetical protein